MKLTYSDLIKIRNILTTYSLERYHQGDESGMPRISYNLAQKVSEEIAEMESASSNTSQESIDAGREVSRLLGY